MPVGPAEGPGTRDPTGPPGAPLVADARTVCATAVVVVVVLVVAMVVMVAQPS